MADKLPEIFRKSSPINIQYDWVDFTNNVGYKKFYLTVANDNTATTYFLSTRQMDSPTKCFEVIFDNGINLDLDFDITFLLPMKITAADAFVNFSVEGTLTYAHTVTVKIYHYDGASETLLGTKTVGHDEVTNENWIYRECLKIPLSAKQFKAGDILRVNVITTADTAHDRSIWFDPLSSKTLTDWNGRTIGTDFWVDIPFKVDL